MKKFKKLFCAVMCVVMLASIAAVAPVTANAAAPKLNKKKITIRVGKTYKLTLKNAKASKVKWSTSKSSVATVYKGKVTAKKKGTAKVTAKYKGKKYVCTVTVKPKISYFGKVFNVYKNDTIKLVLRNSWGLTYNAKKWTSSKPSIASITSKGIVKGKKLGTTTITAYDSNYNEIKGTVKVVNGFVSLKNYINKHGKKNSEGLKCISTTSGYYHYEIAFSPAKNAMILSGKYTYGSNVATISATIPYGATKANFVGTVNFSSFSGKATASNVNLATFTKNKNLTFVMTEGDPSKAANVNSVCNSLLTPSFSNWSRMLIDKLTMGIAALGFSKYPLCS